MSVIDPAEVASALPPALTLGSATSSHQIEGALDADGRGTSIWEVFAAQPGAIDDGSSGAGACDHYNRWADDVAMMADLGMEAYRFSIAWPRIQPEGRGRVEERGLAFYDRLVDGLLAAGIQPVPTLYHWDLPQPLEDAGGWPARDTAGRFADYAHVVAERLGDRVTRWATLNEPWCASHLGYHAGDHAPGVTDPAAAMAAAYTLLRAHHLGDAAIRAAVTGAEVGAALNVTTIHPRSDSAGDADAVRALDAVRNRWWLDGIVNGELPADALAAWEQVGQPDLRDGDLDGARPDWLGINYYFSETVTSANTGLAMPDACCAPAWGVPPEPPLTDMGWSIDPEAFTSLLLRVHQEWGPIPLVITENGAAFPDGQPVNGRLADPDRTQYLADHLLAVAEACRQGAPVESYLAWSLMDNFEWARGYAKRFGIVHVDYDTQVRTPKDSARWYAEVIGAQKARR